MKIPPGGFAGNSQMTFASRMAHAAVNKGTARRRRAKKTKTKAKARRKSNRKMKFGSPAWQKKYKVGKYRK